jgi:hypothetical protein
MEVSISLLRDNKDTLMGVLEPFIRDPTVSWGRSGRAQREENSSKGPMKAIQDTDNRDAKEALLKITERLNGIYNLCHPSGKKRAIQVYRRAFLSSSLLLPYTSFSLAHTKHIFFLPYMKTHTHTHTYSFTLMHKLFLPYAHSFASQHAGDDIIQAYYKKQLAPPTKGTYSTHRTHYLYNSSHL